MPRRIGEEVNALEIHDNISNSDIVLHYRNPTTAERSGYANECIMRKRNRVEYRQAEARLKYGLKILTGFRAGDFERKPDGKWVPMSSEEGADNYFADWKEHLKKHAADLIMLLAAHVFDGSAEINDPDDDNEDSPAEDAEKNLP